MTTKEKAQWIIDHYRQVGPEDSKAIMADIEVAIEFARREGAEAEREACAEIARRFKEEATKAACGVEFYKTACAVIEERIRARSEKPK
jgi:hypothetical protein